MSRSRKQTRQARAEEPDAVAEGLPLNEIPITIGMLPDVVRVTRQFAAIEATTALDAARAALNLVTLAINERRTRDMAQDRVNRRLHAMLQLSLPREYGFHYMAKAALADLEREEREHPLAIDGALPDIDAQLRHLINELTRH